MAKVFDRVKMTTATTGTGTVTLGSAVSPYQTLSAAGGVNADVVDYLIEDGTAWEIGTGTYTSAGTTLSRTLLQSSTGSLLNLSGSATVTITPNDADIITNDGANTLKVTNGGTGTSTQFTTGSVVFAGASGVYSQDNANLLWDNTNKQLELGAGSAANPSYSYTGGSTVGMFFPAANTLAFSTNSTERIRVNSGGEIGVNSAGNSNVQLTLDGNMPGSAVSAYSYYTGQTVPATATSFAIAYQSSPSTAAVSFTLPALYHFIAGQGTFGGGSIVTNQYGFYANSSLTGATNNYGFYSAIPAGTGDWNFYANGTAQNYFAGDTGIGIAPDGTQFLHIAAGTTAKAPLELTAGTNMTTVDPGSVEYDGTCLYFTPFGTSRSAVKEEQLVVLGATNTLTSQTGAQPLFDNATANGRVDLAVGTYQFECFFSLTAMSATSGSFGFALVAGTAVIASQGWLSVANKAALATAANGLITYNTAANTTLVTGNSTTTGQAFIKGFFRITTAGTIVPSVSLGQPAAAVVGVQSYFKCSPVSPTGTAATNLTVGNWS